MGVSIFSQTLSWQLLFFCCGVFIGWLGFLRVKICDALNNGEIMKENQIIVDNLLFLTLYTNLLVLQY